jgi:WD40 repeat protein
MICWQANIQEPATKLLCLRDNIPYEVHDIFQSPLLLTLIQDVVFQGSVHPSGSCIAIAHTDFSVRIYNMTSGNVVACAKGLPSPIGGVYLLETGRLVASSSDGCVLAWDVPANTIAACQVWYHSKHEDAISANILPLLSFKAVKQE